MPALLDLVCKKCSTAYPQTEVRGQISKAWCGLCDTQTLRVTWKRRRAPGSVLFRAVKAADGSEVTNAGELSIRAAKVMQSHDQGARVIFDDDKAASKQRIEEIRHKTWEHRQGKGIDAKLMAETDAMGKAASKEAQRVSWRTGEDPAVVIDRMRTPSALDAANLNRHGTTDPKPEMVEELGIEVKVTFEEPRPVVAGDYENSEAEATPA